MEGTEARLYLIHLCFLSLFAFIKLKRAFIALSLIKRNKDTNIIF